MVWLAVWHDLMQCGEKHTLQFIYSCKWMCKKVYPTIIYTHAMRTYHFTIITMIIHIIIVEERYCQLYLWPVCCTGIKSKTWNYVGWKKSTRIAGRVWLGKKNWPLGAWQWCCDWCNNTFTETARLQERISWRSKCKELTAIAMFRPVYAKDHTCIGQHH